MVSSALKFLAAILVGANLILGTILGSPQVYGAYTVDRVVDGLNQPTFLAQAPGENSSLYIVERNDGGNQLGRIRRYDLQTHNIDTFLDVTGGITSDGGLLAMAFHPDYQTNGRFYITSNTNGTNALDEYKVVGGTPQFQRRLLQYQNLENVFHTINQVHFRPNGNNNELFVTSGDGGTQAASSNFNPALIESPTSPYGKIMKIDLNASFPTPANGPDHVGIDLVALGLRNPYRTSFDRDTGDFYIGDVGFNTAEEVDYIPASHFSDPQAPVLDFGWTDREGTYQRVPGGGSPGDVDPIFDYAHSGQPLPHTSLFSGQSITGGYLYRGPVSEFQGQYFFSDFVTGDVYSGMFDTSTDPTQYDGTNLTNVVNRTADFESRIDGGGNIQFVTSFAEDNSGNLYIVKFGNSFFPAIGEGEIFRLTPVFSQTMDVLVDRDTGAITLTNNTGAPVAFTSLSLTSAFGSINPATLTPIAGNYDAAGGGAIDDNDNWAITSAAGIHSLFSEATSGDAGTFEVGESITYSPGNGWLRSPIEDLQASLLLDSGSVLNASVSYTGNGGNPFERSDLNFDGQIDVDDWSLFLRTNFTDLSGLSLVEAYALGDLNEDGISDHDDFLLFKSDYNAANGAGSFEDMLRGVPEPTSLCFLLGLAGYFLTVRLPYHNQ